MTTPQPHDELDDPVVREVRAIRSRLWREAGGTAEGLLRLMRERAVSPRLNNNELRKRDDGQPPAQFD